MKYEKDADGIGTHAEERAWIEIDLRNLRHNAAVLQKAMPRDCGLMAVVKCEAYGHGGVLAAQELERAGVKAFAVAVVEEGIRLRENGIRGEILILGYTDVRRAADLARYDLMQSLIDYEYAEALSGQGTLAGMPVKTHVKIDTGMHRLGIPAGAVSEVRAVFRMKGIKVCGIYTHLCCADSRKAEDIAYTKGQIALFYHLMDALEKEGVSLPKKHIQSSYGLLNYPGLQCDYVRAGIALYGVHSAAGNETALHLDLRPVFSLKSRVALIRSLKKGDSAGYGRCFTAERDSRIAILPIGYGDGYPGDLSCGRGRALIRRQLVPVVGRICMDQLIVDITDAADIAAGDVAVLIGAEGFLELSAPCVAGKAGRISNELLCRMGARLPVKAVEIS
ncbi:MAG: serine racemase VanT catalytic subunit [Blautia sp.]|nr:serine racemase VanT catalytic subunit [Blautia sp.]MCM1201777.1 serine racemase VanT catalytic subunit [Bacteroides fragilis]